MQLRSDDVVKLYGHMNKDLLKALRLKEDWYIKKIGPITLKEWTEITIMLGEKNYKLLSFNKTPDDEEKFNSINVAISPAGLRIIKDNETK